MTYEVFNVIPDGKLGDHPFVTFLDYMLSMKARTFEIIQKEMLDESSCDNFLNGVFRNIHNQNIMIISFVREIQCVREFEEKTATNEIDKSIGKARFLLKIKHCRESHAMKLKNVGRLLLEGLREDDPTDPCDEIFHGMRAFIRFAFSEPDASVAPTAPVTTKKAGINTKVKEKMLLGADGKEFSSHERHVNVNCMETGVKVAFQTGKKFAMDYFGQMMTNVKSAVKIDHLKKGVRSHAIGFGTFVFGAVVYTLHVRLYHMGRSITIAAHDAIFRSLLNVASCARSTRFYLDHIQTGKTLYSMRYYFAVLDAIKNRVLFLMNNTHMSYLTQEAPHECSCLKSKPEYSNLMELNKEMIKFINSGPKFPTQGTHNYEKEYATTLPYLVPHLVPGESEGEETVSCGYLGTIKCKHGVHRSSCVHCSNIKRFISFEHLKHVQCGTCATIIVCGNDAPCVECFVCGDQTETKPEMVPATIIHSKAVVAPATDTVVAPATDTVVAPAADTVAPIMHTIVIPNNGW
jgi:hypothetical protein